MMIVYKITDFEAWHKLKGNIEIKPILSNKGYFLTDQRELWPELDWNSLETMELTENDLIKEL